MDRPMLNYITSILLLISVILAGVTGVFKFLLLYNLFGPAVKNLPLFLISAIHDWSGMIMTALVIVHIILNWKFMAAMTKKIFKRG